MALAGCHRSTSTSTSSGAGNPATTSTGSTTSGTTTGGSGACSYLTAGDVAPFFTGTLGAGTPSTDGDGPGSKDCLYQINGTDKNGLEISTNVDFNFWKDQFSVFTPVSGVGDEAYSLNNGLALLARKGTATCLTMVVFSDPSQITQPVDSGGAVPESDRSAFAAKLGALCAKALG